MVTWNFHKLTFAVSMNVVLMVISYHFIIQICKMFLSQLIPVADQSPEK